MSLLAVCEAPGTSSSTTTALVLASSMPAGQAVVCAECDPTGGDLAAWCGLSETPGWATAAAAGDRSWSGLQTHLQKLPSGLSVLCAPTRGGQARVVIREAANRFAPVLRSMSEVITVADCGRVGEEPSPWLRSAQLVLLVVRQSSASTGATVARVDRAIEAAEVLATVEGRLAVVVIGARPYGVEQLVEVLDCDVFGALPEDQVGAGLASGAWTIGRGASRSPLARAGRPLAARVSELLGGTITADSTSGGDQREVLTDG